MGRLVMIAAIVVACIAAVAQFRGTGSWLDWLSNSPEQAQVEQPVTGGDVSAQTETAETAKGVARLVPETKTATATAAEAQPPVADVVENRQDAAAAPDAPDAPVSKVVVIPPEGYAVEDSMTYYVPADQRRAGNLGGPPPPVFMVPENANGERVVEGEGGFAPPPAMGQ